MTTMRQLILLLFSITATAVWAQIPRTLEGSEYRGTGEAEHQEGCEGCGNVGMVRFLPGSKLDYLLPGSDILDRKTYTQKGDRLTLEGGQMTMELKGDSLFIHAHGHRYPYILQEREREQ
jgi:hypothetical protein